MTDILKNKNNGSSTSSFAPLIIHSCVTNIFNSINMLLCEPNHFRLCIVRKYVIGYKLTTRGQMKELR